MTAKAIPSNILGFVSSTADAAKRFGSSLSTDFACILVPSDTQKSNGPDITQNIPFKYILCAPRIEIVHAWILQSAESWVEHFLLVHNNTKFRNGKSRICLI